MNISLTPELEKLLSDRVRSGRYRSASEVVREALRLLLERDELQQLRRAHLKAQIEVGIADLDAGRFLDFDEAAVDEVKRRGRELRGRKT